MPPKTNGEEGGKGTEKHLQGRQEEVQEERELLHLHIQSAETGVPGHQLQVNELWNTSFYSPCRWSDINWHLESVVLKVGVK